MNDLEKGRKIAILDRDIAIALLKIEEKKNKELAAHIADLERRNAMLVDTLRKIKDSLALSVMEKVDIKAALSATSADTEAWLQAEIVKRLVGDYLSKVEAAFFNHDSEGKDATTDRWERRRDEWRSFKSYLLYGSPLATPEERIKEGRI